MCNNLGELEYLSSVYGIFTSNALEAGEIMLAASAVIHCPSHWCLEVNCNSSEHLHIVVNFEVKHIVSDIGNRLGKGKVQQHKYKSKFIIYRNKAKWYLYKRFTWNYSKCISRWLTLVYIELIISLISGLNVTVKTILRKVVLPKDISISQNLSITVKDIIAQWNISHIIFFIHTTLHWTHSSADKNPRQSHWYSVSQWWNPSL